MIHKPFVTDLVIYDEPDTYTEEMTLLMFDSVAVPSSLLTDHPIVTGFDVVISRPNTGVRESCLLSLEDAAGLRDFLTRVLSENVRKEMESNG